MMNQAFAHPLNNTIPIDGEQASLISHSSKQDYVDIFVVFVGHTECYWLKWLKSGFRHCFVGIRENNTWLICDSLKQQMNLFSIDALTDFDLPTFYAARGYAVLVGRRPVEVPSKHLSIEFLTCVAVAKRLLGIQASWVWTPWQLFQFLLSNAQHKGSWQRVRSYNYNEAKFKLDTCL